MVKKYFLIQFFISVLFVRVVAEEPNRFNTQRLTVSETGVGPVNGSTPFDFLKIKSLLPGFLVSKGKGSTEGQEFSTIEVADRIGKLFVVAPGDPETKIFSVVITSSRVDNQYGFKVGSLYQAVFPANAKPNCFPGQEEQSGTILCSASGSHHVNYLFEGEWKNGADGQLPPADVVRTWKITAIVWKP